MSEIQPKAQVVIHGGGVAGAILAKSLSAQCRVVLVDPNDYFETPMSAPRSLVNPAFADKAIIPFSAALPGVPHIRGSLIELGSQDGIVQLADGRQTRVKGDLTVLATGATFSNPLLRATHGASSDERRAFYRRYQQHIAHAQRILIVGGGPVGVEVAGEMVETYPDKAITVLESGPRLLAGTSESAAAHAARFLRARGVTIFMNERLEHAGGDAGDATATGGEARTSQGRTIAYDLLIWAVGGRPNTGYMTENHASKLDQAGRIRVSADLRVAGMPAVFALGDITDLDENKMAWHIAGQVEVAAHNIRALLAGEAGADQLRTYKAQTGNRKMAVTLGSRNGVVHLPPLGVVHWGPLVRMAKAGHMLVPKYRKALGVPIS